MRIELQPKHLLEYKERGDRTDIWLNRKEPRIKPNRETQWGALIPRSFARTAMEAQMIREQELGSSEMQTRRMAAQMGEIMGIGG